MEKGIVMIHRETDEVYLVKDLRKFCKITGMHHRTIEEWIKKGIKSQGFKEWVVYFGYHYIKSDRGGTRKQREPELP